MLCASVDDEQVPPMPAVLFQLKNSLADLSAPS